MQLPGFTHITFAALSFGAVSYHYVRNRYEENYHVSHALRIFTMAANLCLVLSGLLILWKIGWDRTVALFTESHWFYAKIVLIILYILSAILSIKAGKDKKKAAFYYGLCMLWVFLIAFVCFIRPF